MNKYSFNNLKISLISLIVKLEMKMSHQMSHYLKKVRQSVRQIIHRIKKGAIIRLLNDDLWWR